jgi:hypothetical protein
MTSGFTPGDNPSVEGVVEGVLQLFPESQREAARVLVEPIVLHRMAGLAKHPRPAGLAEAVYERLAESLQEVEPGSMLQRLQIEAFATEVDSLFQDSLALAVARYGSDHPDAAQADAWAAHRPAWLHRDADFYAAEAARLREERDRLLQRFRAASADVAGALRPVLLRADHNLGSASTGVFATASGSLADFLTDAGADFEYLDFE